MEIGCQLPMQGAVATRDALVTFARQAEGLGMASLWVSDHVVFPYMSLGYPGGRFPHPPEKAYLEPVTLLAAAAMCTSRARLGASVFVLGHRHPVLMAKMLTTIDTLSNGRLICGVGVGWWQQEIEILGAPFSDIGFAPKPVQKPHPPIWVGGDSAGAFRRVVALGDGWHASGKTPAEMRDRIARLRAAADAAGRPWKSLAISLRLALSDDLAQQGAQAVTDLFGEYKQLGLSHLMVDFRRDDLGRMLELLELVATKVRPAVAA